MMKKFKMKKCPWVFLKENNYGDVHWCKKCGTVFIRNDDGEQLIIPEFVLTDESWEHSPSLYCPDRK